MEMKVAVILSEAKDLQFRSEANQCRFFASLRMTDFRESGAKNSALSVFKTVRGSSPCGARACRVAQHNREKYEHQNDSRQVAKAQRSAKWKPVLPLRPLRTLPLCVKPVRPVNPA